VLQSETLLDQVRAGSSAVRRERRFLSEYALPQWRSSNRRASARSRVGDCDESRHRLGHVGGQDLRLQFSGGNKSCGTRAAVPIHYRSLHKVGTTDGEGKVPAPPSRKATAATPRIYITRQSGFVFMGQFRILRTRTSVKLEAIPGVGREPGSESMVSILHYVGHSASGECRNFPASIAIPASV
jgi:hypothetical protein